MAGSYKQMLENADARPWWQYVAVLDGTRLSHKVLAGRTFRFDDPFWSSHYPPNGFNCRCRIRTLSDSRMEAEKVTPQSGVGNMVTAQVTVPAADGQQLTRPVTGYKVPKIGYVAFTDPGFSANPDASWLSGALDELVHELDAASPDLARAAVDAMTRGPVLGQWLAKPVGNFPLAVLPAEDAGLIGARSQVARLSPQTAGKQAVNHPELTADDYATAQEAVDTGERIQDSARSLIYVMDEPDGVVVVVKATREGDELFVQSLRRMSAKQAERDEVLRRIKRKSARLEKDER